MSLPGFFNLIVPSMGASVGLAIGAMYFARCIHPPGGATACFAGAVIRPTCMWNPQPPSRKWIAA